MWGNWFTGRYHDYGTRQAIVPGKTPEEAFDWVQQNAQKIYDYYRKARGHNGRLLLRQPSDKNLFLDKTYPVKPSTSTSSRFEKKAVESVVDEGAGPSPGAVKYHMRKAKTKADEYAAKHGVSCTAKLLRASNGEAAIVYVIKDKEGKEHTVHSLNENVEGKNGYVCFYKGKRMEVHADTSYEAQKKAAALFKAKKSHEVSVTLAQKDGEDVEHVAEALTEAMSLGRDGVGFHVKPNGNLVFTVDEKGREFVSELLEEHKAGRYSWDQIWSDIMDPFQSNGMLSMVHPEQVGAMTEAPMVTDELEIADNGDVAHVGKVWWYPNYMVSDPLEVLVRDGQVEFTLGD